MPSDLNAELDALLVPGPFTADTIPMVELVNRLEKAESLLSFAPTVFSFMERHPEVDFGAPGPFTHLLEDHAGRGYEALLLDSFRRRPTQHTAMMLHRHLNSVSGEARQAGIALLEAASRRADLDAVTAESVLYYLSSHVPPSHA
jgi:hypothetical protein